MSSTMYEEIMRLGPLRYYPLADASGSSSAADVSANGQNGTVHGTVTFGQSSILKASALTSALFGGASTDYISCPVSGLPTGANSWTMGCWIYLSSLPDATQILQTFGTHSSNEEAYLNLNASNKIEFSDRFIGTITSTNALSANTAYLVLGMYDGTKMILNINGTQQGTLTHALNIVSGFYYLGQWGDGTLHYSKTMAHVFFLSGTLSANQITRLYNVGQGAEGIVRGSHRAFGRVM